MSKIGETLYSWLFGTLRLHTVLVCRANYLRQRHRTLSGGAPRRKFLQQDWELKLEREEFDSVADMATSIHALSGQVSSLTKARDDLQDGVADLEAQARENDVLSDRVDTLEVEKAQLKQKLKSAEDDMEAAVDKTRFLADKLRQGNPSVGGTRGRSRTKSHQRRLKRQQSESCKTTLSWLELEGYTPLKVEVLNQATGCAETLTLGPNIVGPEESVSQDELDIISMMLLAKDWYNVSSRAYHEMASICKSMPKHYKLKRQITELNCLWNIRPTPNGTIGVQQSLEDRLRPRIARLLGVAPEDAPFRRTETIRVKLSGDGTWVGKRLHVVNFTFTSPDEGALSYSSEGITFSLLSKFRNRTSHLRGH